MGEKGFVGGTDDTATGLTDLGTREYQPGTGSFISPDPLLKPYDPLNLNAYAYAADSPSTYSGQSPGQLCNGDTCADGQVYLAPKADPKPKGYSPAPSDPAGTGNRIICGSDGHSASAPYHRRHPDPEPKTAPVHKTPPAHPVTNGRDTNSCPMQIMGTQIGFLKGGCADEGLTDFVGVQPDEAVDKGEWHPIQFGAALQMDNLETDRAR